MYEEISISHLETGETGSALFHNKVIDLLPTMMASLIKCTLDSGISDMFPRKASLGEQLSPSNV